MEEQLLSRLKAKGIEFNYPKFVNEVLIITLAMMLLQEKIPPYIVECFRVSGFDDIDSNVAMNTDIGPKNSVHLIESYIERRKASLPQCVGPNQIPNIPFEFPQGHRIRIDKFIRSVKLQNGVKKGETNKRKSKS